jgi:hypothetical protein
MQSSRFSVARVHFQKSPSLGNPISLHALRKLATADDATAHCAAAAAAYQPEGVKHLLAVSKSNSIRRANRFWLAEGDSPNALRSAETSVAVAPIACAAPVASRSPVAVQRAAVEAPAPAPVAACEPESDAAAHPGNVVRPPPIRMPAKAGSRDAQGNSNRYRIVSHIHLPGAAALFRAGTARDAGGRGPQGSWRPRAGPPRERCCCAQDRTSFNRRVSV